MRIKPNETYEEWSQRVCIFEIEHARKQLAKGEPIDEVLEWLSKRIIQKLIHPIVTTLKEPSYTLDVEASKKAYNEAYLSKSSPKPDHLTED